MLTAVNSLVFMYVLMALWLCCGSIPGAVPACWHRIPPPPSLRDPSVPSLQRSGHRGSLDRRAPARSCVGALHWLSGRGPVCREPPRVRRAPLAVHLLVRLVAPLPWRPLWFLRVRDCWHRRLRPPEGSVPSPPGVACIGYPYLKDLCSRNS